MKTFLQFSLVAIISGALLSSCSVQKRQYRPGYEISWNNHKKQAAAHDLIIKPKAADKDLPAEAPTASAPTVTKTDVFTSSNNREKTSRSQKEKKSISSGNNRTTGLAVVPDHKATGMVRSVVKQIGKLAASNMLRKDDGRVNGFAVASLVLGIVALVAYYGAFVLGVLAIVFGAIALSHIRRDGGRGRLMALAGLICGIVALAIIVTIIMIAATP